jgi:AcrR family transcriptional regulator
MAATSPQGAGPLDVTTGKVGAVGSGAMETRRRLPRAEREPLMLAAARRAFEERGYRDASMDDIAAAAGITKPMLYAYFGSKQGLYEACLEQVTGELIEVLEAGGRRGTDDVAFWHGLLALFDWVEANERAWAFLYLDDRGGPPGLAPVRARSRAVVAAASARLFAQSSLRDGISPDVAARGEGVAYALFSAVGGAIEWWLEHRDEPKEMHALRLMNLLWQGLGDLQQGRLWFPPPERRP